MRGVAHGVVQGGLAELQGGKFLSGFASGALGSWAASGYEHSGLGAKLGEGGMFAFSALSGGIGEAATGGNFMRGFANGLIVASLNHSMHDPNNYKLVFTNGKLYVVDTKTNKIVYSTDATSGKGEYMNDPKAQGRKNEGPIPEGEYSFKSENWKSQSTLRQFYNILALNGDWGDYNVPLDVVDNNNSPRSRFYLHGGMSKGSAGCIDAGRNIYMIYNYTNSQKITKVYVKY